ncbi:MAG: hypothetical protein MR691_08270 [Clostridium sp.]|nr:hypothetical protein [Clostridium sp.]
MYVYYVVYDIMGKNGIIGKGTCMCNLKRKITDYDVIKDAKVGIIKDVIENYPNLEDVLITNFILLRKEKKNEKNYIDKYTDNSNDATSNNTSNN